MASAIVKETDFEQDDVSIISSMSTKSTGSTTPSPPLYSSLTNINTFPCVIEQISSYLELECNDRRDQIISDLLKKGRQALYNYREDIIPEIMSQEEEYLAKGESPLLKLLKQHIPETWEMLLVNKPTILSFINNAKKGNFIHFDNVLTRTAEHGSAYEKASFILSIVLQLLSESIDDECFMKTNTFIEVWNSITIQGIHGIKETSKDIPEEELNEQINNKKSALYAALRMYFEEEMKKLFKDLKIPNRHNTLYDLAIDSVTENGWLEGIKSINKKITATHYDLLTKSIKSLIEKQLSTRQTEGSTKQDSDQQQLGNHTLPNEIPSCSLSNPILPPTFTTTTTSTVSTTNTKHSNSASLIQSHAQTTVHDEIELIIKCIKRDSLYLENLVEAGELTYVDKTLKDISSDIINCLNKENPNLAKFITECQIPIMFLLKRQQNLGNFISILTNIFEDTKSDQSLSTTFELNLRTFLHVLLSNSDIFLSRTIMSLISKRNPVPFVEPNIRSWSLDKDNNTKYEFIPSIIHIWDHTRPTILSFGIGNDCRGKTSLLNVLFQSTFEQSVNSIYFQQTIDIDFGYSFNPERQLNIADCHGEMSIDLLTNEGTDATVKSLLK